MISLLIDQQQSAEYVNGMKDKCKIETQQMNTMHKELLFFSQ